MLATAKAQRALIVDAWLDAEMEPELGGSSGDVEGQIPTGQTISNDE